MNEPERVEEKECPNCDKPQKKWKDTTGYTEDGQTFCCKGCARKNDCECE